MSSKHTAIAAALIVSFAAQFGAIAMNVGTAYAQRPSETKSDVAKKRNQVATTQQGAFAARRAATTGIMAPRATVAAPLTATECTNMGGTVYSDTKNCRSGKICATVGSDQVIRTICVTEKG
jgi:hypothetical protein